MSSEEFKNNRVLSITGPSFEECKSRLFAKYGTNFQIISKRNRFKKGILGFFQNSYWELQYQISDSISSQPKPQSVAQYSSPSYGRMSSTGGVPSQQPVRFAQRSGGFLENRDDLLQKSDASVTATIQLGQLSKEFEKFQQKMESQMQTVVQATSSEAEHKNITRVKEILEDNEFTRSYIKMIVQKMKQEFRLDELEDFDMVQKKVLRWIGESIPIAPARKTGSSKIVMLVGPTGVGKTTTVAKMGSKIAVEYRNNKEKYTYPPRIRMITADTMRVAAQEQLSRWAEIINVKVDKAENSDDLKQLCDNYTSNSDYIFVDTSGYSPNDFENIARLRKILDVKNLEKTIYLTVIAGVGASDFENIIRNYEAFNFSSIILTKCDETLAFGRVISVLAEQHKNVSWLTTGQEVLNTIEKATPEWFLKKLTGFRVDEKYIDGIFANS